LKPAPAFPDAEPRGLVRVDDEGCTFWPRKFGAGVAFQVDLNRVEAQAAAAAAAAPASPIGVMFRMVGEGSSLEGGKCAAT
jgi:hypothetical protein